MIKIELTSQTGYEEREEEISVAVNTLNKELSNKKTVFIDGTVFMKDFVTEDDLKQCKRKITVTNKLVGG